MSNPRIPTPKAAEHSKVNDRIARPPVETLVFEQEPQPTYDAVTHELMLLLGDLRRSSFWRKVSWFVILLVVVLIINMIGQIYLNQWQGRFYRALEQKNISLLWAELRVYGLLITGLLMLVVSQTWLHERLKVHLREWLSVSLLDRWLVPGRAYRLNISSDEALNPDQRIQDDVRNLAELASDLGIGLVQASLLLVSFIGVLWTMSNNIYFQWDGATFTIPGYMVWAALLYAVLGSWATAFVGRPLINLNETRYAQEASFRFSLVRVSESAESIAFYSGEQDERKIIDGYLGRVLATMLTVSSALARLTWITSGYGWIVLVLPILVALPGYMQGALDLGGLMVVVGAFGQVQQSLRWFVDNFAKIATWRAALHRVVVFREALIEVDEFESQSEQIQITDHAEGHLAFENTKISLVDGEVVIENATAHIRPGERVLIAGDSGSGKSTLFRAVAGLWPWGSGVVQIPPRKDMMFLPQRPYMPLGTLAEALAYPHSAQGFTSEQMQAALKRVNLEEFSDSLHINERWDKLMSLGQQQRFAFARVLLQKPKWIFLDEATSALDEANQDLVMSLFTTDLDGSTLLSIGHRPGLADHHTRTLQLISTPAGTILRRRPRQAPRAKVWQRFIRKIFSAATVQKDDWKNR
jgi:putative ATP-binding cassette transporter